MKRYRTTPWLSPKVEIRRSKIHGRGTFARGAIVKGDVIAIWGGKYVTKSEAYRAKRENPNLRVQQIDDDVFEVFTKEIADSDPTYFQNHSCDPNSWMGDEVTISARRDIRAGEELTIDYVMFEMNESHVITENCTCGSSNCRKRVTGTDWKLHQLQERYKGHFSPLINRRIAQQIDIPHN
jgi:uncharacterized protein